jgi:hypothetical protein
MEVASPSDVMSSPSPIFANPFPNQERASPIGLLDEPPEVVELLALEDVTVAIFTDFDPLATMVVVFVLPSLVFCIMNAL